MTVAPPQSEFCNVINIETRRIMGVSIGPELAEYTPPPDAKARLRKWARSYLSQLDLMGLTAEQAAACAAADVARVRELRGVPAASADDPWSGPGWRDAAIEYHNARGNRVSLVEHPAPRAIPISMLQAAEFLLRAKDPARIRRWLSRHSAAERKAILRHLEQRKR